jgi:hypothetical protein
MRANNKSSSFITATHFFLRRRSGVFSSFAFFFPFFCHDRFNLFCLCHILFFLLFVVCPAPVPGKIICCGLPKTVHNRPRSMRDTISGRELASFFLIRFAGRQGSKKLRRSPCRWCLGGFPLAILKFGGTCCESFLTGNCLKQHRAKIALCCRVIEPRLTPRERDNPTDWTPGPAPT